MSQNQGPRRLQLPGTFPYNTGTPCGTATFQGTPQSGQSSAPRPSLSDDPQETPNKIKVPLTFRLAYTIIYLDIYRISYTLIKTMETQPELLDFIKALSNADRLRIIGLLAQKPMRAQEIASALDFSFPDSIRHLDHLVHGGVLRADDRVYTIDSHGLENLARLQFEGRHDSYTPAPDLNDKTRKVLAAYLNPDGAIKQIPLQPARLKIILDYIVNAFTPGVVYTEKEVNMVIRRFHVDISGLRRDLVDSGMLKRERDGSRYWRAENTSRRSSKAK
jgi:hypothetical protein